MEQSVINTLCYAQVFDFPLTEKELYRYLISSKKIPWKEFRRILNQLSKSGVVVKQKVKEYRVGEGDNYYGLSYSKRTISKRHTSFHHVFVKTEKTRKIGNWLHLIPTVQGVFLTGSQAMNNVDKDDDIDLMIVTRTGSLWFTRLLVTIVLQLLGVRRKPLETDINNLTDKICVNLYLDEDHLKLSKNRQNLYTAHEIIQAKPIWTKPYIYKKFLFSNSWVRTYLPHTPLPQLHDKTTLKPQNHFFVNNYLGKALELLAYKIQVWYMNSKLTTEYIDKHRAFFHPRDTVTMVLARYQKYINQTNRAL